MTEQRARWNEPGYSDISAARVDGGELEVAFVNGDLVRVQMSTIGVDVRPDALLRVEDGLRVSFEKENGQPVGVSWTTIRAVTDPEYARHLRDLAAAEAGRVGRRLRALREDRGVAQAALAEQAGLSGAQLSRIEKGGGDYDFGTVRAVLRALGARPADIAGPDAPEISLKTLVARAEKAGVPRDLGSSLAAAVDRRIAADLLARAFAWTRDALLGGVPEAPPLPVAVQFKAAAGRQPTASPLVNMAWMAALAAEAGFDVPTYRPVPNDPATVRRAATDSPGHVTLASLLAWTWESGIPVLPLVGKGGFSAAVLAVRKAPTIVIKEARELAVFWLFDLAHELGHVALGHLDRALVDIESPWDEAAVDAHPSGSDADETAATAFALELLLPNHRALLDAVRADARGSHVRFKFAVERVAASARVSVGLLGMVAAYELPEIGLPKDRWGSATNLARTEGTGRDQLQLAARRYAALGRLDALDAALLRAVVLGESP